MLVHMAELRVHMQMERRGEGTDLGFIQREHGTQPLTTESYREKRGEVDDEMFAYY
jgi:hypothetical protein